jgi:hypothetical protein
MTASLVDETTAAEAVLSGRISALTPSLRARLLTIDDARILSAFRADIIAHLPDPDFYRLVGEAGDFVRDHLGAKGVTAGVFDRDGCLVAYGALGLPQPGDINRGAELGLPAGELAAVAHVSSAMVRPDWYQHGLHHCLLNWRLDVAAKLGKRHLLTTVSSRNHQSWAHLAAHGLLGKKLIDVGGGLTRLLVHRDLAVVPKETPGDAARVLVPVERLVDQAARFADGYWLWRRVRDEDGIFAELRRPVHTTMGGG